MLLPQHSPKHDKSFKKLPEKQSISSKSLFLTYLLWFFAGCLGAHRFYLRFNVTGALQFLLFVGVVISFQVHDLDALAIFMACVLIWWGYDFSDIKSLVQRSSLFSKEAENTNILNAIQQSKVKESPQLTTPEQSPKEQNPTAEELQSMRDLFARWDQTNEHVVQMIDYLNTVVDILSDAYGANSREIAEALGYLGNSYFVAEQYEEAVKALKSAFAINRSYGDFEKLDRNTVLMVNSYIRLGALDDAEQVCIDLVSRTKGLSGPDRSVVARACYHLAMFYETQDQSLKAGYMYVDAMQYYHNIPITNNLFKLQLVRAMATNLIERTKYYYAEIWLKKVIEDVVAENVSLVIGLTSCHRSLAELYTRFGMFDQAEERYLSMIKLLTPLEQKEHILLGETFFSLGQIYYTQQKYSECVDMAHQLVQLNERTLGVHHDSSINARRLRSEAQDKLNHQIQQKPILNLEPIIPDESRLMISGSKSQDSLINAQKYAIGKKTNTKHQEKPVLKDKYVFQKVKWLLIDFPEELESEQAYMYGGLFLGWLADHDLLSLNTEFSEQAVQDFKKREISCVDLYCRGFAECIFGEDLTEEGFFFMLYYYEGNYGYDYEQVLTSELPSIFHVKNTWENYELIAEKINQRYKKWKEYF